MDEQTRASDILRYTPPGISWTAPEKGRPWSSPPSSVDAVTVALYYINVLTSEEAADNLLDVLEKNAPLSITVQAIMLNGVMSGFYSMEVGVLVAPVILEMLISICEANNLEYNVYPEDYDKKHIVPDRVIRKAIEKSMKKLESGGAESKEELAEESVDVKEPKGFLMRREKEVE